MHTTVLDKILCKQNIIIQFHNDVQLLTYINYARGQQAVGALCPNFLQAAVLVLVTLKNILVLVLVTLKKFKFIILSDF